MDENHAIPENADKVLFVEDLVLYVMKRIANVEIRSSSVGPYRNFIYNAFTDTTINAIENLELREQVEYEIDVLVREHGQLNATIYDKYAKAVYALWFPSGSDPRYIIPYSAQIAHMAAHFFIRGLNGVHKLAISNILSAFEEYDVRSGGWDIFKEHTERYATMAQGYQTLLQPESGVSRDIEESKIGEINVIAQNAEKTSFAKNVVHYVMCFYLDHKILPPCITEEKYRTPIFCELTANTKEAIDYLSYKMEIIRINLGKLIYKHKFVTIDTFKNYASSAYNHHFSERFYAINFLPFCAHLASLAVCLYEKGVSRAPELAILDIERICKKFDTTPGGWDILNKYAERYAFIARENYSPIENTVHEFDDDSDTNLL